ncbi:hypothetical protein VTJ04DRAFT_4106 [Mycothermus thermophilus]|uniref:uncharacterized protein n=1 Tax=Humicola insolens TaxID=85995 RepID=UPI0037420FC0
MNHLSDPIAPCAQVPLISGIQLDLLKAIKDGGSYWAISCMFPRLAQELRSIGMNASADLFAGMGSIQRNGGPMDLFHSVPRDLLASVILGTIAYDTHPQRPQGQRLEGLEDDGPGIYALGISINGRDGAFLTLPELKQLIEDVETYHSGVPQAGRAPTQAAHDWVRKVDGVFGGNRRKRPTRFVEKEADFGKIMQLRDMLVRLRDAMVQANATSQTHLIQSPVYVGCSNDLSDRLKTYDLDGKTLKDMNRLLGLTVSLLKARDLEPMIQATVLLRTWARQQLPAAEMLLAGLAGAYSTQRGFNVAEAGGNKDKNQDRVMVNDETYVFATLPHLAINLDHSLDELRLAEEIQQAEQELEDIPKIDKELDDVAVRLGLVNAAAEVVQKEHDELHASHHDVDELLAAAEARKRELQRENRLFELMIKMLTQD